jgi:hypothetical protein
VELIVELTGDGVSCPLGISAELKKEAGVELWLRGHTLEAMVREGLVRIAYAESEGLAGGALVLWEEGWPEGWCEELGQGRDEGSGRQLLEHLLDLGIHEGTGARADLVELPHAELIVAAVSVCVPRRQGEGSWLCLWLCLWVIWSTGNGKGSAAVQVLQRQFDWQGWCGVLLLGRAGMRPAEAHGSQRLRAGVR